MKKIALALALLSASLLAQDRLKVRPGDLLVRPGSLESVSARIATRPPGPSGVTPTPAPSTLLTDLESAWPLSADGQDAHGANDLTNNNGVTFVPLGPSGVVADFVAANLEKLTRSATDFGLTTAASWSFWIKPAGFVTPKAILSKWQIGGNVEWVIEQETDSAIRVFVADSQVDPGNNYIENNVILQTAGVFNHVVVAYDGSLSGSNRVKIYINGVSDSVAMVGTVPASLQDVDANFDVGVLDTIRFWDGGLGRVGIWARALSQSDVTSIFNSGKGKSYTDLAGSDLTNLVSYWNLDEASGNRADSHGSNTLTDNNTVGSTTNSYPANMPGTVANFVRTLTQTLSADTSTPVADGSGDYTVAGWMKLTTDGGGNFMFAGSSYTTAFNDGPWLLQFHNGNRLQFVGWDAGSPDLLIADPYATFDQWHLIVMTHTVGTKTGELFVDNVSIGTDTYPGALSTPTKFSLGGQGATAPLDGQLFGWLAWSRVLTPTERACLFSAGAGGFYPFTGLCN